MEIYNGDKKITLDIKQNDRLEEIIATLDISANESSQIISEIKIDGVILDEENEKELNDKLAKNITRIDLIMEDESILIKRALNEAYQYLPNLSKALEDISLLFQSGSRNEAFEKFADCLTGWIQIVNLMQTVEKLKELDYALIKTENSTIKNENEKLLSLLTETKSAMEKEDIVSLSDLIEYELSPMAQKQMEVVKTIIDTLNK